MSDARHPIATRRQFLAGTAGAALGAGLLASPAVAQSGGGGGADLATWFENTDNADGIVDERGTSSVEITVGAEGNGGAFAFEPAAVRVDPGTTVVWTWTGEGGTHNVVATNGEFESEYYQTAGETFEHAPEGEGLLTYACAPHESVGMKGALVVGDVSASLGGDGGTNAANATNETGGGESASGPERTFGGWLENTDNYAGVVDGRGEDRVTVKVGAEGNGGAFAFDPPAIHVDPDTIVVWKWVGDAGAYDVVDERLGYRSDRVSGTGHRFAVAFGGGGVSKYECEAYGERGMRGVVVIGDPDDRVISETGTAALGGGAALLAAPLLYGLRSHAKNTTGPKSE
ncbi:halocyanin domain-containing protein [Halomarina halobia]|uniref:Halocyanin domain-containing protein n=1 Tax=Halomarina halobia TaxID=3033386 RepID=A0ABD6ADR1_9EURY|nr:halocyanin domain-containing protein [Halomarina sp. PSR21]